jgi:SAM-dependent methyltransferase
VRIPIPRGYAGRLCSETLGEVHAAIAAGLAARAPRAARLLDVGCWDGEQTARYAAVTGARPYGVELFAAPAADAVARGVGVVRLDLERDRFPFPDETFDVVVVNQVLEHLKNVWLPIAEMYRVLRTGGLLVASVPNLASLHNRVLLALGAQPTSIRVRGPHVRGYAAGEFVDLLELGGALAVERVEGVGFHPLPPRPARALARAWAAASHTPVYYARKRAHVEPDPWTAYRAAEEGAGEQTSYPGYGEAPRAGAARTGAASAVVAR